MILHLNSDVPVDRYRNVLCSGGSRNFKTRGRGGGRILRSGVCFDTPSHKPYVFVVRVGKKNSYCKHCILTKIKVFSCFTVKIYKNKHKKFQAGVRAPDAPVLDPPLLCCFTCYWLSQLDIIFTVWYYRYLSLSFVIEIPCSWSRYRSIPL